MFGPRTYKSIVHEQETWILSPVIWPLLNWKKRRPNQWPNKRVHGVCADLGNEPGILFLRFSLFGCNAQCKSISGLWKNDISFPLLADSGFCSVGSRFWLRRRQIFRIRISTRVPVKNDCVQEKALWFIEHRDLSDPLRQLRSFNAAWLSPKWIPVIRLAQPGWSTPVKWKRCWGAAAMYWRCWWGS